MNILPSVVFVPNLLFFFFKASFCIESITQTQSLTDGKTLVSKGGTFELGFFSPGSSKNRYLGIWYKNIPVRTVVWVANRIRPINDSSGILMINSTGSLLLSQNKTVVWSTSSSKQSQEPFLELLDSGNLVLRDKKNVNSEDFLWQSFDYPSDTLLPGMKHGWDLRRALDRRLTAWKNWDDPSPGDFIFDVELHSYPEAIMWKGTKKYCRTGPWNGVEVGGILEPEIRQNSVFGFKFVNNEDEVYYSFYLKNTSVITRIALNQSSYLSERSIWSDGEKNWKLHSSLPWDGCDDYNVCGAYGNCILSEFPRCHCLKGFKPKSQEQWESMDWSQGCVRNRPLSCHDRHEHGFLKFVGLKIPDTTQSWVDRRMNLEECQAKCLNNCSCMAYSNLDVTGKGSGCALWFGDLLDMKKFGNGDQPLYIRMHTSELDSLGEKRHSSKKKQVGILVGSALLVTGMTAIGLVSYKWRRKLSYQGMEKKRSERRDSEAEMELPIFDLTAITSATDNFSNDNKLGEGGFGPVYKGTLPEGREIAVKRLSKNSGQGPNEFKNEVILIAKLQHRNLVKLLGCCIQGNENMLIYEYMPNRSLDSFIFDQTKSKVLDWHKRMNVIRGIAKGLLYLHEDSRLRIIHRDLKVSNILLDKNMDPKISDFGLARSFAGDQVDLKTYKIVGTYGYISPEYAMHGHYSIKSDIFSFGVLILEIISGKKNRGFSSPGNHHNLLGHAWKLWIEDRGMELIDESVGDLCETDVIRTLHVGLLCVQQRPEDRPDMSSVVQMLGSKSLLPKPRQPGFFTDTSKADSSSSKPTTCSANEDSITSLEGR